MDLKHLLGFENKTLPYDERFYNIKGPDGKYPIEHINDACLAKRTYNDYMGEPTGFTYENGVVRSGAAFNSQARLKELLPYRMCADDDCLMKRSIDDWADLTIVDNGVPLVFKLLQKTRHMDLIIERVRDVQFDLGSGVLADIFTYVNQYVAPGGFTANLMMRAKVAPPHNIIKAMAKSERFDCHGYSTDQPTINTVCLLAATEEHKETGDFEKLKSQWIEFHQQRLKVKMPKAKETSENNEPMGYAFFPSENENKYAMDSLKPVSNFLGQDENKNSDNKSV